MTADPKIDTELASEIAEARRYIETFRRYTMPGVTYVDTPTRMIRLDSLSDADALFVAAEFRRIEATAAERAAQTSPAQ